MHLQPDMQAVSEESFWIVSFKYFSLIFIPRLSSEADFGQVEVKVLYIAEFFAPLSLQKNRLFLRCIVIFLIVRSATILSIVYSQTCQEPSVTQSTVTTLTALLMPYMKYIFSKSLSLSCAITLQLL